MSASMPEFVYNDNDQIESVTYKKAYGQGKRTHRTDGPAFEKFYYNGVIKVREYRIDGELHRENGLPAFESFYDDGSIKHQAFWINGVFKGCKDFEKIDHLEIKPEITYHKNGKIQLITYKKDGKYHREDGPAFERFDDGGNILYRKYYINDMLHRDDAPAVIEYGKNGNVSFASYFKDGNCCNENGPSREDFNENGSTSYRDYRSNSGSLHKDDGPAIQTFNEDGTIKNEEYFLRGKKYTKEEFYKLKGKEMSVAPTSETDKPQTTYYNNGKVRTIKYRKNNQYHREDGPAYLSFYEDGTTIQCQEYHLSGKLHRTDGAAYQAFYANGTIQATEYRVDGKLHRDDGYAYERFDSNGSPYFQEQWENGVRISGGKENNGVEINTTYHTNGKVKTVEYKKDGKYHREDGPAYQSFYENGNPYLKLSIIDNKYHNLDGPAYQTYHVNGIIYCNKYYVYGKELLKIEFDKLKDEGFFLDPKDLEVYDSKELHPEVLDYVKDDGKPLFKSNIQTRVDSELGFIKTAALSTAVDQSQFLVKQGLIKIISLIYPTKQKSFETVINTPLGEMALLRIFAEAFSTIPGGYTVTEEISSLCKEKMYQVLFEMLFEHSKVIATNFLTVTKKSLTAFRLSEKDLTDEVKSKISDIENNPETLVDFLTAATTQTA